MSLCKAMENTKKRYPRVSISFFALARISSWLNTNHWTPAKYYWNIIVSFCAVEYGKVGNGDILFFSRHCIDSVFSKFESHNSSFQVKTDIWTFLLDNFHPSQQGKIPDARERKHYLPTPAWGAIVLDRWCGGPGVWYSFGKYAFKMGKSWCFPGSSVAWEASVSHLLW